MEEKKKRFPPRNEGGQDRQRISVRPGNFNPPPRKESGTTVNVTPANTVGVPTQASASNGEGRNGGPRNDRRNNHNRNRQNPRSNDRQGEHSDGSRRDGERQDAPRRDHNRRDNREENRQRTSEQRNTPAVAQNSDNGAKNSRNNRGNDRRNGDRPDGGRHDGDRRDGDRRNNRGNDRRHADRRDGERREEKQAAPQLNPILRRELDEEFSTPTLSPTFGAPVKSKKQEEMAVDSEEFAVDIATAAYLLDDIPCGFPIPDGKSVEVVGVRFRRAGKIYFFAPDKEHYGIGDSVLVDTARGPEIGEIVMLKRRIAEKDVIQPLRSVLRRATAEDKAHEQENRAKEAQALKICAEKIAVHKLDMKLVDAQYTFDNSKLLFYFTSEGRVDFRELVRDLAGVFHTRIELRQIGIRDESRLIGGLGMCGRPFCCSTFLSDFGQVSIKMAKEQGLSINTSKISGCCGRLMCCLRYEHETYAEETRLTPKRDAAVITPDGNGVVVESTPLAGTVKVRLDAAPEEAPRVYHRDTVTVIGKEKRAPRQEQSPAGGTDQGAEAEAATENRDAE